jgi:hypothetical protein
MKIIDSVLRRSCRANDSWNLCRLPEIIVSETSALRYGNPKNSCVGMARLAASAPRLHVPAKTVPFAPRAERQHNLTRRCQC